MKRKSISKKLILSKKTISGLNSNNLKNIKGGATTLPSIMCSIDLPCPSVQICVPEEDVDGLIEN